MTKLELDGWMGDRSACIKEGNLTQLQKRIQDKLTTTYNCNIDTSRKPHIELTTKENPRDNKLYNEANGRDTNINQMSNWNITRSAIMLRFGSLSNGKQIHVTMAYSADFENISRNDLLAHIKTCL